MFRCQTFSIAAVLVCASPAWAQASFTPLIAPPGQAPVLHALGVSADGSTAVGVGVGPLQAYRWSEETGIVPLTTDLRNEAYDTSATAPSWSATGAIREASSRSWTRSSAGRRATVSWASGISRAMSPTNAGTPMFSASPS